MSTAFDEIKATQIAAQFINLAGGEENYTKLTKLIYLADRKALEDWGYPITFDDLYSLPNGTIVSHILNFIREQTCTFWNDHIKRISRVVKLIADPGDDELSEAEKKLVEIVFTEHIHRNWKDMIDYTHELPEYTKTKSRVPITYKTILEKVGYSDDAVDSILKDLQFMEYSLAE